MRTAKRRAKRQKLKARHFALIELQAVSGTCSQLAADICAFPSASSGLTTFFYSLMQAKKKARHGSEAAEAGEKPDTDEEDEDEDKQQAPAAPAIALD